MIVVAGLGNPGEEYQNTRHNAGRIVLDRVASKFAPASWKQDSKSKALITEGKIGKQKALFMMPETFMNNSGKSVAPFIKSKKDLAGLVVIYDDLDLPIGKIKISFDRGDGGHNGLASVIKAVKSREFARVRIGVSPATPSGKLKKPSGEKSVIDFILGKFKDKELDILKKEAKKLVEFFETFSASGLPKAMSEWRG